MNVAEVDVVIPAYAEDPAAIERTVDACRRQTHPVANIFVVDDHSPEPVRLSSSLEEYVEVIRLPSNRGQATARNVGIAKGAAPLVLCLDVEVKLKEEWVEKCTSYVEAHPQVGACCGRIRPLNASSRWSRWRMKFLEAPYEEKEASGSISSATGHAVMFRREALTDIGGYDEKLVYHKEDFDVCQRLKRRGWEVHLVTDAYSVSIQTDDDVELLAKKLLRNNYWAVDARALEGPYSRPITFPKFALEETRKLGSRLARNTLKGRLGLLSVDLAVWGRSMQIGLQADYSKGGPQERETH